MTGTIRDTFSSLTRGAEDRSFRGRFMGILSDQWAADRAGRGRTSCQGMHESRDIHSDPVRQTMARRPKHRINRLLSMLSINPHYVKPARKTEPRRVLSNSTVGNGYVQMSFALSVVQLSLFKSW